MVKKEKPLKFQSVPLFLKKKEEKRKENGIATVKEKRIIWFKLDNGYASCYWKIRIQLPGNSQTIEHCPKWGYMLFLIWPSNSIVPKTAPFTKFILCHTV